MALNYITLVLDLADGTSTPLATGQALLNPSAQPIGDQDLRGLRPGSGRPCPG